MCGGSEAGSYFRLIDFVYHSTLGLRVINKKKKKTPEGFSVQGFRVCPFRCLARREQQRFKIRLPENNGSSQGQNICAEFSQ